MYDLIVIGGGPAGSSTAIPAARSGARVLLLDRGQFPRHKVCGEFVSAESLGLLADLLDRNHSRLLDNPVAISSTRIFIDGRVITSAINPPAASIARFDLDAALLESAARCGVEARHQVTVQSISGAGPFRVSTSSGDFEGRAVVNASGRWSNLTKARSNGKPATGKWLGLKGHFSESDPAPSVDLYFFDGGYCGVQPVSLMNDPNGGRVNACAMVRADVATTLDEVFGQHPLLKRRSEPWKPLIDTVSTSPLIFREPDPAEDGVLNVGDAAVFIDPFVGDGISLALRSGQLASESLIPFISNQVSLASAASSYVKTYRQRLVPVFKASSMVRRIVNLPRPARAPLIYLAANIPALSRQMVKRTR